MKTRTLQLPHPAAELFETVYPALHDFVRPVTPGNIVGRLGGGTALAAQWGHRRSTDIDITVPEGTGLNAYEPGRDPSLVRRMEQLGAVRMSARYRTLIFEFPHGKLDIVEMEMPIRKGERLCEVDGKAMLVHSNSQILAGKLVGCRNMTIARDVFDIAVASREDPGALQAAINHMEPGYREDVAYRLGAYVARYRDEAPIDLLAVAPRFQAMLSTAPQIASQALTDLAYSSIELSYPDSGVALKLRTVAAVEGKEFRYASARALVEALPALGLEPYFMAFHGTVERMVERVDRSIAGGS